MNRHFLLIALLNIASWAMAQNQETISVTGVSFKMIKVEGGTFKMGATNEQNSPWLDENPAHKVTLSTFYIGETEVTQALWKAVMGTTTSQQREKTRLKDWKLVGEGDNYPMYIISWEECQEFISRLNHLTGRNFRLPTEAEWEYAARGGNKSRNYKYSGSNMPDDVAWYENNSGNVSHPVKMMKANELGLYDMSGSMFEWCQDWYGKDYYSNAPKTNPMGPDSGIHRVCRGGPYNGPAGNCRVASRAERSPEERFWDVGLRLAF